MLETLLKLDDVNERCGFLLRDGTIVEFDNVAPDPQDSYEMKPEQVLPYLDDESKIEATWHTHPDGVHNLSGADYLGFLSWPDLDHIIIGRLNGKVVLTRYHVEDGVLLECE